MCLKYAHRMNTLAKGYVFYDTVSAILGIIYGANLKYIKIPLDTKHSIRNVIKYLKENKKNTTVVTSIVSSVSNFFSSLKFW